MIRHVGKRRTGLPLAGVLALFLAALLSEGCAERMRPDPPSAAAPAERPAQAAETVAALRTQLLAALPQALGQGPEAAIDACRIEAPRIAERVSANGVAVGRTSHRLRSPGNAPEPWMLPLLEEFRTNPQQPGAWRSVDLGTRGTGYVEPIYLQPLCATCHGESVDPTLLQKIRALYRDDEAVGFAVGDFRGLFLAITPRPADP